MNNAGHEDNISDKTKKEAITKKSQSINLYYAHISMPTTTKEETHNNKN